MEFRFSLYNAHGVCSDDVTRTCRSVRDAERAADVWRGPDRAQFACVVYRIAENGRETEVLILPEEHG